MRHLCLVVPCMLVLAGCHAAARNRPASEPVPLEADSGSQRRPVVTIHGQPVDGVMLNPVPPVYDIGAPAGDVVQAEFRVDITDLVLDDGGVLMIRATVRNAGTRDAAAFVAIDEMRDGRRVQVVRAGANGEVQLSAERGRTATLVVRMLGYRSLELDLELLARAAARSAR